MKYAIFSTLVCILLACPTLVSAQPDWRRPGSHREAVEGPRSNNNHDRPSPSRDDSDNSRSPSRDDSDRKAREAIIVRYENKIDASDVAVRAGDYRLAARLRREAVRLHEALGETQYSRAASENADRLEKHADAVDASKAGNAAAAAGNYALALKFFLIMIQNPAFDIEANRNVIAEIRYYMLAEQARQAEEAENIELAAKLRKQINDLASSLDTALPASPLKVVAEDDGLRKDPAGFGYSKPAVRLKFGDPNDTENLSEQGQQGFDTSGRLKGSEPVKSALDITATEILPVSIPKRFSKDPQIVEFQNEWKAAGDEKAVAEKRLAEITELRKEPNAKKEELDVKEVEVRLKLTTAKSKQDTAVVKITDTVKMLTFKEQKLN